MDEEHDYERPEHPIQHGIPGRSVAVGLRSVGYPCVAERFCETRHAITLTNPLLQGSHVPLRVACGKVFWHVGTVTVPNS